MQERNFFRKEISIGKGRWLWPVVFCLCLLSRTLSSVHYIEDADSLRFALAVLDYDIASLQPHFPGYPVFCFLVKMLYAVTGRFAYAFALAGGLATFVLLWAGFRMYTALFGARYSFFFLLLLFLNPMLWLMANRYMPDLMGAALALACLAVFLPAWQGGKVPFIMFFLLAGLLAGVRLSYIPIVLLPGCLLLLKPARWHGMAALVVAILLWFVPMTTDTGLQTLIEVASTHTEGHFTQWGGTVVSEPSHAQRLQRTIQFVWAHGLGGYWANRHWSSAVLSLFLGLAALGLIFRKQPETNACAKGKFLFAMVLAGSGLLYFVWIYFFQNVVHQSRHVLPLLPLLLLYPAGGLGLMHLKLRPAANVIAIGLLAAMASVTGVLIWQHKKPTAVYQVKEHIRQHAVPGQTIISLEMINQYLELQGIQAEYVSVEKDLGRAKTRVLQSKPVWVIGDFPQLQLPPANDSISFFHNPYMNSLWPEVRVYRYGR